MIDYKKYIPTIDDTLIIRTSWNEIRKVKMFQGCYYFTDCTHPNQNCYCNNHSDIVEWEYENKELMEQLAFTENEYQKKKDADRRQKEADKILATIKITWLDKIKF